MPRHRPQCADAAGVISDSARAALRGRFPAHDFTEATDIGESYTSHRFYVGRARSQPPLFVKHALISYIGPEMYAARISSSLAIAPALYDIVFVDDEVLLVFEYIDARPLSHLGPGDLPSLATKLSNLLTELHATPSPPDLADATFFVIAEKRAPELLTEVSGLAATAWVHNDPHLNNLLVDHTGRLWLIDWTHSGHGRPAWDWTTLAIAYHAACQAQLPIPRDLADEHRSLLRGAKSAFEVLQAEKPHPRYSSWAAAAGNLLATQ